MLMWFVLRRREYWCERNADCDLVLAILQDVNSALWDYVSHHMRNLGTNQRPLRLLAIVEGQKW